MVPTYTNATSQNSSIFDLISQDRIPFLCTNSSVALFVGPVEGVDFCSKLTYSNLATAMLFNPQQFGLQELVPRLLNRTLNAVNDMSGDKLSIATVQKLVADLRFALAETSKLPRLDLGQMTQASKLMDAVFCGGITEMLKRDTGNKPITFQLPPVMLSIQSSMIKFVQNIGTTTDSRDRPLNHTTCANNISLVQRNTPISLKIIIRLRKVEKGIYNESIFLYT
uniref:Uncharacterized protein n=1 Tax=Ditylenchus dipsaci TaxID=166011 RepID=A0A915CQU4_9BILA